MGEPVTLGDYVRLLRERWPLVVAGLVIGLVLAAAVTALTPAQYSAKSTVYVSASSAPGDTASSVYDGSLLSVQRMKSYSELVTSVRVSQEVVKELGVPIPADELSRKITASTQPETVLLSISVTDDSPDRAAQLANGVAAAFTRLVAELEKPDAVRPPLVVARVVEPAAPPTTPVSPILLLNLGFGAVLGLLLGFGLAVIREKLDNTVKSLEQLRDLLGVPGLGVITYDRDVPERPLTVYEDPHSPRAEAFRQLRTNLQFVDVDNARKMFVVTSSLPSEGKTTTLCNLAVALADGGSRVLVIEADLRRPTAADNFGVDRATGLTNVLTGRVSLDKAIKTWRANALDVLPSGPLPPNPSELLASQQMATLLEDLRRRYNYILLDTPPMLLVTDATAVAPRTDGVILLCRYGKTTRNQVLASARAIEAVATRLLGTVLTMAPTGPTPKAYKGYYSYYQRASTSGLMDERPAVRATAPAPQGQPMRTGDGAAAGAGWRGADPGPGSVPSPAPRPQNGDWAAAPSGGGPRARPGPGEDPADR